MVTVLASFLWKGSLWGLGSWGFLSPFIALVLAIVFIPQLFLKAPLDPLGRIPSIRPRALELVVTAAVVVAVLWLLRARHDLWGERSALVGTIETSGYRWSAPLAGFLYGALYRFMNDVFLWSSHAVLTFTSIVAGVLYTLAAIRTARLIFVGREGGGATAVSAAVLLANGFVVIFFGGGGPVALAALFVLLFTMSELEFLQGKCSLALPTLLFALAVLSHITALFLLPGYLYTAARGFRTPAARTRSAVAVALLAAAAIVVELGVSGITGRPGPMHQLLSLSSTLLGGLAHRGSRPLAADVRDGVNAFLLIGPAAALSLFLFIAGGSRLTRRATRPADGTVSMFLSIIAASSFLAAVLLAGRMDGGLRWYAAAAIGPALSIYLLWALGALHPDAAGFVKAALICAGLGLFHTVPWIIVNAVPPAAEKRLLSFPLAPGRNELILADADFAGNELDAAHRWYLAALEKDPSSLSANLGAAAVEMKTENYAAAITHYGNVHQLRPGDAHYQLLLAQALIANRWYPEAIANLEELTASHPDSVAFWRRLGFARNNSGRYEAAVAAYERALALEPQQDENLRNLVSALLNRAAQLQSEKKYAEAEMLYRRVIGMYPEDWHAYNNLATIYMKRGDYKNARAILESAVRVHPYESSLHFNLGIVLDKLGKTKEALDQMIAARDLNPMYSTAPWHIERLQQKLGIWQPTRPDSIRNPFTNP